MKDEMYLDHISEEFVFIDHENQSFNKYRWFSGGLVCFLIILVSEGSRKLLETSSSS